jgi:outer membrane receptor protein involved in Fe transport
VGRVVAGSGTPVSFANVQLLAFADSSAVTGTLAQDDGSFRLEVTRRGDYLLYVSLIGYESFMSDGIRFNGQEAHDVGIVRLDQSAIEMKELSVEARRELYEQKADRLVINVGNSVTLSGKTALQVLAQSPGVVVNEQSGSISMIGKEGVVVMINGKRSYVPASGLVQVLAGMSADNIESIELITSPPASLDAEGNAGFINIVMKQNPDMGLNGTLAGSAGYGDGEVGSVSATADYRRRKLGIHASYTGLLSGQMQYATAFRRIESVSGIIETPMSTVRDPLMRRHDIRMAIDYTVNDRTSIGGLMGAYTSKWMLDAMNKMTIETDGALTRRIESVNDEINHWRHVMGSLYVQRDLSERSSLRTDVDYVYYHDDNPTTYLNTTTDVAGGISEEEFSTTKLTPIRFFVAKADYESTELDRLLVEGGVKGAFSRFVNDVTYEGLVRDAWVDAAGLVSNSALREDIVAAYGALKFDVTDSVSLQVGLRYEHTTSNLGSDDEDDLVDRSYGNFFPSIAYSHTLSPGRQVDASYTRRITRPSFTDMAPFLYFISPNTFFTGNTALQPAITSTLKFDVTAGDLLASLQYAWEDGTISRFQNRILKDQNVQLIFTQNLRQTRTGTALVAIPVHPTSWWSTQNNVMLTLQEVSGLQDGASVTSRRSSIRLNSTQNFSLPLGLNLETSGYYQSATYFGLMRMGPGWQVDMGLQKSLPRNYGKVTVSVNNLFDTGAWTFTSAALDKSTFAESEWDMWQRYVQLTYSVRFGDGKAGGRRSTASTDEQSRVQ